MYNNDEQNQAASGQGTFIRRAINNRPVDNKAESGGTSGYQSGTSGGASSGYSGSGSGYQGGGTSGYQSGSGYQGGSGYQSGSGYQGGGSSGGYRSSYNSGYNRGSRDYGAARTRHDNGYGGGGYNRGGGGYNRGAASGAAASGTDRLVRQDDLIIKLLKDIRDRLPAPPASVYRYGNDSSAESSGGSYGEDTAATDSVASTPDTADNSSGDYGNSGDATFDVAVGNSEPAAFEPRSEDDDSSGNV